MSTATGSWEPPFRVPSVRYRCSVRSQVPVTLQNVQMRQRSVFVAGSPSTVGWAAAGVAAATLYGRSRQRRLEGQTRLVGASGEAVLMDDRLALRLVATDKLRRVKVTGDAASRTVDYEIPYRIIRQWGTDRRGVWLDVVGQGVMSVQPQDRGEFAQWFAHLSHEKTWRDPTPLEVTPQRPVVGWCQQDRRFVFGMPGGWVHPTPQAFTEYARNFAPWTQRALIFIEDGDWEAQVLVFDLTGDQARDSPTEPELLAVECAAATSISPMGPIHLTNLDGQPAVLMRGVSSTWGGIVDRTYVHLNRHGVPYGIWYSVLGGAVGDGSHERWLPDFRTMLATWHWYG
jgi:hypothetical protein